MKKQIDQSVEVAQLIRIAVPVPEDEPLIEDWTMVFGNKPFIQHDPTGCIFQIGYDPELLAASKRVTIHALYAIVVHDDGWKASPAEISKLGREAIMCFWALLTDPSVRGMDLSGDVVFRSEMEIPEMPL